MTRRQEGRVWRQRRSVGEVSSCCSNEATSALDAERYVAALDHEASTAGDAALSVSEPGLVAAFALLAKGSLGVLASLTLAATTEPQAVLDGLRRLRMPDLLVQIMGFMIRYLDVVTAELGRMMTALRSRGCDPRSPRHWPVLARSLGALFIRSYERGERVHLAMLSRGYDGKLPQTESTP